MPDTSRRAEVDCVGIAGGPLKVLYLGKDATEGSVKAMNVPVVPSCLVLDIRLPGSSGFDLQADSRRRPTFARPSSSSPVMAISP